jgi:hypothetical protein
VAGFLKYYLGNLTTLVPAAGYVAPTSDDLTANHEAWPEAPAPEGQPVAAK